MAMRRTINGTRVSIDGLDRGDNTIDGTVDDKQFAYNLCTGRFLGRLTAKEKKVVEPLVAQFLREMLCAQCQVEQHRRHRPWWRRW